MTGQWIDLDLDAARSMRAAGQPYREIAARLGTSTKTIQRWLIDGPPKRPSMEERFWSKVDKRGPDECWNWSGGLTAQGYGSFTLPDRRRTTAHRVVFTILGLSEPPDGMYVCHTCDNRRCVNTEHLFFGTALDNNRDCIAKGRARSGIRQKQQTHCIHGHLLAPPNLLPRANGKRDCRACANRRRRTYATTN